MVFGWPAEHGGRNASLAEQVVLNEETTYHRVGAFKAWVLVLLLGSAILRHSSYEQKQEFLPMIRAGEMNFCLGYSNPRRALTSPRCAHGRTATGAAG